MLAAQVLPVYVVGDDPGGLHFTVAADDSRLARLTQADSFPSAVSYSEEGELRRRYVTRAVRQRLHQQEFRERVLEAYRRQCALCRLRHPELLDAAHIIPDAEERGAPVVRNGLSLCRLHHAAYDAYLLAVRPDYTVEVTGVPRPVLLTFLTLAGQHRQQLGTWYLWDVVPMVPMWTTGTA